MPSHLFHRQILDNALEYGNEIAMTDAETGESITYTEVRRRVFGLAKHLKEKHQVDKGDIVLCFMPNSVHYPIVFLAAALLGATQTGVNPEFTSNELSDYIKKTKCKCIFTTSEMLQTVLYAIKDCKLMSLFVADKLAGQEGIDFEKLLEELSQDADDLEADKDLTEDDVLLTPLSSGTTGSPKCVMLTHRNFNVQTEILKEAIFDKITQSGGGRRCTIAVLPFYHASGFWALCYCLLTGHRTVVMQRFQAPLLLSCIEDYKVDTLNLVPSIITFLLKSERLIGTFDLSSVKIVLCGSAPIAKEQVQSFLEKYNHVTNFVHVAGYGLTEIVALSHLSPLDLPISDTKHVHSCGKLLPRFECKVVCIDTKEEIKGPGERGELWLRSECVMKGYLNEPETTSDCIDSNGWFHTGDIVYFDEDGFFYVVDRIKNVIKVNGLQVSSVELENLLLTHDNVLEAAVIGVPMESFGEVPCAYVVLRKCENEQETVNQLRSFVNAIVAPHKQLRGGIRIVSHLPRSSAGKVLKEELKKMNIATLVDTHVVTPMLSTLRIDVDDVKDKDEEAETFL
ncbi:4-coumarate--CoA ligase 2 [Aphelenchoides besseyi]|nr:4-coumarate--CoA ligase 2 [Aphelenchoides besseyi]